MQLKSARGDRTQHFANLNHYSRNGLPAQSMDMHFWQIDESIYWEFLEMLPPIYVTGGFRMCEHLTGDLAATFIEIGGHYWCGYSTRAETPKLAGRMTTAAAAI